MSGIGWQCQGMSSVIVMTPETGSQTLVHVSLHENTKIGHRTRLFVAIRDKKRIKLSSDQPCDGTDHEIISAVSTTLSSSIEVDGGGLLDSYC